MTVNVRVTGTELLVEGNRLAFLRIVEAFRQYSADSGEPIYLVRRPLDDAEDHVVLLSEHGIALITMPLSRGSAKVSPEAYLKITAELERLRGKLAAFLKDATVKLSAEVVGEEYRVIGIALLADGLRAQPEKQAEDSFLFTFALEEALLVSSAHRPRLLSVSETLGVSYSHEVIEHLRDALDHAAVLGSKIQVPPIPSLSETPLLNPATSTNVHRTHSPYWLLLVLLVMAAFTYIMIRLVPMRSASTSADTLPAIFARTPSEVILRTPGNAELFISPIEFQSLDSLSHALDFEQGIRYLPDTQQTVALDSSSLARGFYAYFKVGNTWRKGMLIRTNRHTDTMGITQFMDSFASNP